jgi:N-acylglucosamine 2-epimerase
MEIARHGIRFIESFGADEQGSYYFSLDRTGHPLTHAHSIFSDCFVATAYHRFGAISGSERYRELARSTYQRYVDRMNDPKGRFTKATGYRDYDNYAILMMWAYLAWQMQDLFTAHERESIWRQCLHAMLHRFRNPKSGLIHEYCQTDGTFPDTFEGRLLNPGHALEGMWFCLDIASALQDSESIEIALQVILQTLEYSWDQAYGGIFYFMDARQSPPQQLEWNHKLWWVHLEALIALIKARQLQPENDQYAQWFNRVLEYTWSHFRDREHGGEWFGYLDRQGQVQLDLKGGKWKGCFHLPRALLILSHVADQMAANGV